MSNRCWGPLAGLQCSERTHWDREVTVGEVAVSLQGRGAAGLAGRAGGDFAGCWAWVSR